MVPLLVLLGVAVTTDPLTELGMSSSMVFVLFKEACWFPYIFCGLFSSENIAGKLVFYQMEGNATYVRDTGELASEVPTETMFELFDPQKNFSTAKFTYTWDLGNGYKNYLHLN